VTFGQRDFQKIRSGKRTQAHLAARNAMHRPRYPFFRDW